MLRALTMLMIAWLLPALHAQAQQPDSDGERQPIGNSLPATVLADLPSGTTIFSVLDTAIAELISDRIDAGNLTVGQPARFGAHGSSWTQTTFRIGDVDFTDPATGGSPLLLPGIAGWERVTVGTGAMALDTNSAGPVVTFVPMRPGPAWTRSFEVFGAPTGLLSRTTATIPPAIARLGGWNSASLLASGPLVPGRLGLLVSAAVASSRHYEREDTTPLRDRLASVWTHLVFTPNAGNEVRILGWVQRTRAPFSQRRVFGQPDAAERATALHLQSVWERPRNDQSMWTGFASFSARRRTTDLEPVARITTERLRNGPVPDLVAPFGTDKAWSIGARMAPIAWDRRHTPEAGITLSGGGAGGQMPFPVRIGELVAGVPARVWDYSAPASRSSWRHVTLSAYGGNTVAVSPRLTLDGGLRFELVSAGADGNPQGVSWHDWYPHLGLRWELTDFQRVAALVRLSRYGQRLPLRNLAYGDATAPTADVYRWAATGPDPGIDQLGPLVERVGPGTGDAPGFSTLDPQLERPYVNELTFGVESRPSDRTVFRMLAIVRQEGQLMGVVNTGVPRSSYAAVSLIDPGVDHAGGNVVIAFDRLPSAFGADRFVLTNPAGHHATFASIEITAQKTTNRLFLIAGATAGRSEETSANRGFLATENDHGLLGEVFTDPNAETNARGRPFTERGYTIKTAGTFRFSDDLRLGVAARYQDGQHFARLVVVPGLNQGAEAIRAFVNGKTRFTYTLTIDARLQKDFRVRGQRLTTVFDVYNALNTRTEIEEFALTGPLSRTISAVQPPRSIHLGLKLGF